MRKKLLILSLVIATFLTLAYLGAQSSLFKVALVDTDKTHYLTFNLGSNLAAARSLTWLTGDADRQITLNGNPTLDDWFNQSVKSTASPTFSAITHGTLTMTAAEIKRNTDAGALKLQSFTTLNKGAKIELYGAAHASYPGNIYIDYGDFTAAAPAGAKLYVRAKDNGGIANVIVANLNGQVGIGGAPLANIRLTSYGQNLKIYNSAVDSIVQLQLENDARKYSVSLSGTQGDKFGIYDNTATSWRLFIDTAGSVLIGDDANAKMTLGLTINQAASDDEILALKSSDVAHGITSGEGLWGTETDTFAYWRKRDGLLGGLFQGIFSEDTAPIAWEVYAIYGAASTAKDATASGAINFAGLKADPANATYKASLANENIFCIKAKAAGDSYEARFIVDAEGDYFYDGTGSAFQNEDDVQLVKELEDILTDRIPKEDMVRKNVFKKHKVVHINEVDLVSSTESGKLVKLGRKKLSRFVSARKMNLLFMGAIRQLNNKISILEQRVAALEAKK